MPPEVRNRTETWALREKGDAQGSEKSRWLVIRYLPCKHMGHLDIIYLW